MLHDITKANVTGKEREKEKNKGFDNWAKNELESELGIRFKKVDGQIDCHDRMADSSGRA